MQGSADILPFLLKRDHAEFPDEPDTVKPDAELIGKIPEQQEDRQQDKRELYKNKERTGKFPAALVKNNDECKQQKSQNGIRDAEKLKIQRILPF